MNCNNFKEWLTNRDLFKDDTAVSALKHLNMCSECEKLYRLDSKLDGYIKRNMAEVEPPERLLRRVEMNTRSILNSQDKARWSLSEMFQNHRKQFIPAFAVMAVLLILLLPVNGKFKTISEISKLTVDDHMKHLSMAFAAGDVSDIPVWFESKLGFEIVVPDLEPLGFSLAGGRKCHLGENDVAYLLYEKGGKRFSLFIIDPDDAGFEFIPGEKHHLIERGCEVDIWKEEGLLYALVV